MPILLPLTYAQLDDPSILIIQARILGTVFARGWSRLLDRLLDLDIAVGDVRSGSVKRVASAVGEGSVVVQAVHQYLAATENGER